MRILVGVERIQKSPWLESSAMYIYTHSHTLVHTHTQTHMYMHVHIHEYIHTHACSYTYTTHMHIHTCLFIHIHKHTYICMPPHTSVHTHTHKLCYLIVTWEFGGHKQEDHDSPPSLRYLTNSRTSWTHTPCPVSSSCSKRQVAFKLPFSW